MDNIVAIGIGLALRAVIDAISNHNHRVNGSLVGLWEGAVLHHFLIKFPRSLDPYVAYGFRLLVDLLVTASATRLAIVMLWTGLGMLLSDVGLDIMDDVRFQRFWRQVQQSMPQSVRRYTTVRRYRTVGSASSVQFMQVPAGSTSVSTNTARSTSVRTPSSQVQPQVRPRLRPILTQHPRPPPPRPPPPRPPPPPTPAPARRPTTHPLPGSFSEHSEVETVVSQERQRTPTPIVSPQPVHATSPPMEAPPTPSELEYIALPVIPDTPGLETFPNYAARAEWSTGAGASGLTTPSGGSGVREYVERGRSGLTTPLERPATPRSLPPVRIIEVDDPDRTPTLSHGSLPEHEPIPIRLRPISDDDLGADPPLEPLEPEPIPVLPPQEEEPGAGGNEGYSGKEAGDDPGKGKAGSSQVERDEANRSPPPPYPPEPDLEDIPDDPSEGTAASVITAHTHSGIVRRADTLREQADALEANRKWLEREWQEAQRGGEHWRAFQLKVERDQAEVTSRELHAKAERRYYQAHNMTPQPQTVDVHRLKAKEAIARVEQALYTAMQSGANELRVITGRGNHSVGRVPILKLAITKHMQDLHIPVVPDANNPGVLLIRPPAKPAAGPSTAGT
ncbi:hypothetical protein WOLCODRAFT_126773 [Wolfiporia cocos MD-104 SS10]|uniref:Smr domain-containing protein n=1 Tax=Wolfiporia cocos (strain MD-104) TaxID=742152 RepID=A0A2H3JHH1_WOLCO|nr:hypothetical protein WOLCODRAFT_126773 [Wolfiporia cocos MD-104 SS10]